MSRLDELIDEFCPDGVEYRKLKEVASVSIGEFVHKNKQNPNAAYPVYNGGTSNTGFYDEYNRTANKIIISARGANAGFVNRVFVDFWSGNSCYTISVEEKFTDWNFAYYVLKNSENQLINVQQKGGIPAVSKRQVEDFKFPLPPLPVQIEIARILDNFTELTAELTTELTTELTARRKQYEYYRDLLLTFGDDVPVVKLGDIGTITRGNGLQKSDFTESGVKCIHYGQIYTYYSTFTYDTKSFVSPELATKLKRVSKGDIIIAVTSENVEDVCKSVAWLGEEDIVTGGHTAIFKHKQNPKYIAYYLQTSSFFEQKRKIAHGTKVIEVTPSKLEQISIPLPPLDEQARIVATLDRFDALCNDLTSGLPAEIEARQKQYEYYRDKLLTFKEVSA